MSETKPVEAVETAVPMADPRAENVSLGTVIADAVRRVVEGGTYILGPEVAAFERELAAAAMCEAAIGVASGTDALVLALLAAGISGGDEVIAPSHTAGPTVAAINAVGATPVLVDIDPDTYCVDPEAVAAAIGSRTRAVIAVHLYGYPADLDRLREITRVHGICLIEDCAQAQGALYRGKPVGGHGDYGCFSFYPTKNLGAIGDGGAIVAAISNADRVRKLRTYGWTAPQFAELPAGRCSRLDELQAAILRVKMPRLSEGIDARRRVAALYRDGLTDLPVRLPPDGPDHRHAYHLYVIACEERDGLKEFLAGRGIQTGLHYPYPVHRQPGLAGAARISGSLANTERAAASILSLPLFPSMRDDQVARVIDGVRSFFAGNISR